MSSKLRTKPSSKTKQLQEELEDRGFVDEFLRALLEWRALDPQLVTLYNRVRWLSLQNLFHCPPIDGV